MIKLNKNIESLSRYILKKNNKYFRLCLTLQESENLLSSYQLKKQYIKDNFSIVKISIYNYIT